VIVRKEKLLMSLIMLILVFNVADTVIMQGFSLTKEDAVEIGRNSKLVGELAEQAYEVTLEVHHLSATEVNEAKENFSWLPYPANRSIWLITWYIRPSNDSAFTHVVGQIIDDETGQILDEETASLR
jgi:hypothetical protein